ncbi:unnamed protein product [Diamesa hyperborea]
MNCLFRDYKFYAWKSVHTCETNGLIIESANETISNIISYQENHESDDSSENHENKDTQLTYDHVLGLYINDQLCNYFPANVKEFFPHLELLQISHSLMNFIEKGNFNGLQELKFVRIISNKISNIPENTFMGAENIIDLKMYSNQIRTIDENAFRGLAKLENLEISKNYISSIELNTFKDLVSLKYLHLSENKIVELPSKLFETNLKLRKLFFRSNKLTTINVDLFLPLNSLHEANFDGNVCVDIDAPEDMSIDDLKSVMKEECTGVQKNIIPENIEAHKSTINVKEIDELKEEIDKKIENVIEHMHHQFEETFYGAVLLVVVAFNMSLSIELQCDYSQSGLVQWEMMYICRAKGFEIRVANQTITNVNDPSASVKQNNSTKSKNDVRGVYFMKMTINFLPLKVYETFPNMKYFGIVDSSLHNINCGDFNGYNKLNVLDITDNNIRTLNDDIFNGTTNLLKLGLNSNQIRSISEYAFKGLLKLEVLNLSKNRIQTLLNDTFKDLLSLKVLNVRRNNLIELPQLSLLISNKYLEDIDLGLNMLQVVNPKLFLHLTNIKYLEFDENYCINEYFTNETLKDLEKKLERQCSESSESINTTSDEIKFLRADINFLENSVAVKRKSSSSSFFGTIENI